MSSIVSLSVGVILLFASILLSAPALAEEPVPAKPPQTQPAKPRLLIEGWLDRPGVSDLYLYDLQGNRLQRLTDKPLPTCVSQAINPGGTDVAFEANASALHVLSLPHGLLYTLHAGRTGAVVFSQDGSAAAYVVPAPAEGPREATIRVKPVHAGSPIAAAQASVVGDIRDLEFAPDGKTLLYATAATGAEGAIFELDLKTGLSRALLQAPGCMYWHPVFTPDGKCLLAIKEERKKGLHSLVAIRWSDREETVLASFPAGREVTAFAFADGGKRIAFMLEGVVGVMNADGKEWEGLSGDLPLAPVLQEPGRPRAADKRWNPAKAPGSPLHAAGRYVSQLRYDEKGEVQVAVYDLEAGRTETVKVGKGMVGRAFLVP